MGISISINIFCTASDTAEKKHFCVSKSYCNKFSSKVFYGLFNFHLEVVPYKNIYQNSNSSTYS